MPLVTQVCEQVHDDSRQDVGRRHETLRSSDIEAHTRIENDGQEVSDRVGVGCGEAEESRKAPNLQIQGVLEVFPQSEFFWNSIMAILFNASNYKVDLFLIQEFQTKCFGGQFGEIDNQGE